MDQEREERPKKKRKKKKSKVGYYLYAVVVLILTIAILVVSTLILFHVQKIEVKGTNYSKKNDIIKWVQEDQYTSNALYALCKFKLGSNKIPPYLEKVQVGLSAPWALKVTVKEKTRIGCVATDEGYAYFDKEGMVLWEKAEKIEEIPLLEGLDVETSELYEKLPVDEEEVFSYFVELTKEMKKHKLNPERIVWEENSMNLYFGNVCVRLGRSRFDEKAIQLPPILEKLEGKKGVLDMEYYNEASPNISFKEEVAQSQ